MANEEKYLFLCKEKEDGEDIVKGVYDSLEAANKAALSLYNRLTYNAQQTQHLFTVSVKPEWLETEGDWESYRIYDLPMYRFDSKRKFTVTGDFVQTFYEDIPMEIVDEYQNRGLNNAEVFDLVREWDMPLEEIMDMLEEADIEALEKAEKVVFFNDPDNAEQPYAYRCIRCDLIMAPDELESMASPRCPKCRCKFSTTTLHEAKDEYLVGVEDKVKDLTADLEEAARDQARLEAETTTHIAELNVALYEAWTEANKGFFARLKDLFTGKRKENKEKLEAARITVEEAGMIPIAEPEKLEASTEPGKLTAESGEIGETETSAEPGILTEAEPDQITAAEATDAADAADVTAAETNSDAIETGDGEADVTATAPDTDNTNDAEPEPVTAAKPAEPTEPMETPAPTASTDTEPTTASEPAETPAPTTEPEPAAPQPAENTEPELTEPEPAAVKKKPMTAAEIKRAEEDAIIEEKVRQLKEMKAKQAAKMAEALEEAEKENSGTGSGDIADMLKSSGSPDVSDVFKTGR